jgi:ligand-binding SRPBCC domain-containing protein
MSRRRTLQSRQWVPYPLAKVWEVFSNPQNLAALTPPHYGASVQLQGENFEENCRIIIRMRPYGIPAPLKWISKIQDIKSSAERSEFVDIQLSGPFAYWRHHHIFECGDKIVHGKQSGQEFKIDEAGTWVLDDVEYEMPYGLMGSLAEKIFARRQLESLFAFRKEKLLELLSEK